MHGYNTEPECSCCRGARLVGAAHRMERLQAGGGGVGGQWTPTAQVHDGAKQGPLWGAHEH